MFSRAKDLEAHLHTAYTSQCPVSFHTVDLDTIEKALNGYPEVCLSNSEMEELLHDIDITITFELGAHVKHLVQGWLRERGEIR